MARRQSRTQPWATLLALVAILAALFGGIGAAHQWGRPERAQLTPLLGLDLEGGRQIVLEPQLKGGQSVSDAQVRQAVEIIRRRVDSTGTSEAEVTTQGGRNIVVSIPGSPPESVLQSLQQSSQMVFRAVVAAVPQGAPVAPGQAGAQGSTPGPSSTPTASASPTSAGASASRTPAPSSTGADAPWPARLRQAQTPTSPQESTPSPTATPTSSPSVSARRTTNPAASPAPSSSPSASPAARPQHAGDPAWATPELVKALQELDCSSAQQREKWAAMPADQPVVACDSEGLEKYILGPSELAGSHITDATAGQEQNAQGQPTGKMAVNLEFDDEGAKTFADITTRMAKEPGGSAQNRFAMVLDGLVISAPGTNQPIINGQASITGSFDSESAEALASQLKFGALPFSFAVQTSEQLSPTLGRESLRWGITAGLIGLGLVALYSLLQYRALGLVTIASLAVAGLLTYGAVTLLGWLTNFRLSMAGITGLIVAIGITADSFIVYFERVRDEVREGRPLKNAVETGWARARRTIIISDAINLLAAVVLYLLSEAGVKAFAFTLGLTTIIDLVVVMLFTHPVLSLLSRTRFFGKGHPLSGLDPRALGARAGRYAGRGRVVTTPAQPAEQGGMA